MLNVGLRDKIVIKIFLWILMIMYHGSSVLGTIDHVSQLDKFPFLSAYLRHKIFQNKFNVMNMQCCWFGFWHSQSQNSFIFFFHLRLESPWAILLLLVNSINLVTDSCVLFLYLYIDNVPLSKLALSILHQFFLQWYTIGKADKISWWKNG